MRGAAGLVARRRLASHWRALVSAGVLLGVGFGLCLGSFAAARRTETAYDRILAVADAPDAAVALGGSPEDGERSLQTVEGIVDQRVFGGFIGTADGVDQVAAASLLAPIGDRFPIELPLPLTGRLPDPHAPGEVFVNSSAAERAGLEIGQRLHFHFVNPASSATAEADVTVVGVGALPFQAVADETMVLGAIVFTRAFYEQHRDLVFYSVSNVDLAPGVDARRDLAAAVEPLGHELLSARSQERQAVNEALRPVLIVLVAIGLLAFGATTVAAGQVVQRNRDRWQSDDARSRILGMTSGQVRALELTASGLIAAVAVATAAVTMLFVSPVAPLGPLHDIDPAQGFAIDLVALAAGVVAIVGTFALLTLWFSSVRRPAEAPALLSPRVVSMLRRPAAVAGITLAWRADDGRVRAWRAVSATTLAAVVMTLCAAFVGSAVHLSGSAASYGFDADLLALNPYGDQPASELERVFASRDDVEAATAYTSDSFLINGRAVPGLAATQVKGELSPTLLRGRAPRSAEEIVLGRDTLESVGAEFGERVRVRIFTTSAVEGDRADSSLRLQVVGVATFPSVNQLGTDMPRLGTGALVTREAFLRMHGDAANEPEFTAVRMKEGADPATVIASNPEGVRDSTQGRTTWFTDAKPAELRQLDAAMPYLRGAPVVGYAILLAVFVHALWTRARSNRRNLAVLRAIGSTPGQLDAVTAWQAAPFAVGALLVGVPLGVAVGRRAYTLFAQSLAVVDDASTSVVMCVVLAGALLLAATIGSLVAIAVARRASASSATAMRE
jgi:ABC-type lipoprotein release transport system permease subunit